MEIKVTEVGKSITRSLYFSYAITSHEDLLARHFNVLIIIRVYSFLLCAWTPPLQLLFPCLCPCPLLGQFSSQPPGPRLHPHRTRLEAQELGELLSQQPKVVSSQMKSTGLPCNEYRPVALSTPGASLLWYLGLLGLHTKDDVSMDEIKKFKLSL